MATRDRSPLPNAPAIAAAVELPPGRRPDLSTHQLYRAATSALLEQVGASASRIDGLLTPPRDMGGPHPDTFFHEKLSEELGITARYAMMVNAGGASYGYMVQQASLAVAAGMAEAVICVGAGKFEKMAPDVAAQMVRNACHEDFEFLYGAVIPALYAQYATRYMHETGTTPDDLAAVSVSARQWALRNPAAITHAKGPITVEDVLASRMIASPFHYLDCSIPCDGGGAVLVTSGALAREITDQPAYVLGFGQHHGHGYVSQSPGMAITGVAESGRAAFAMAGITHGDIDHAQLYDAFSFAPIVQLEHLGFTDPGEGGRWFTSEKTSPGGEFPVNTYGGLIGYGHTGDASGMSMIVEGAAQVMGDCGERQVAADTVLIHSYGGMMAEHCTLILGRQDA
ncbi:thiolase family protein [Williamsia sp. SKLECPSW1]